MHDIMCTVCRPSLLVIMRDVTARVALESLLSGVTETQLAMVSQM